VRERPDPARAGEILRIVVDDDGRGLSASEREQVAERGRRLDETKPGSGLGLSIVVELANLYGGELKLGTAPLGGLRAELVLPAA
jgi:signal transduction histidine kinase